MKVLILANIGLGLYKFRKELLEELVKYHEVFFCIPKDEYVKSIKAIGCKFINNPFLERHGTNPLQELKLIGFYKKMAKSLNPDIVFTYTIKCNIYGGMACSKLGIPYVVNVTGLGTALENGGAMQKITLTLYKLGLRQAQKVFFQNTENRNFMLQHKLVRGAYDLLPGSGVNLCQYKVQDYPNGQTVDFVFIARVMKEKGIDQYLNAAKVLKKKYPQTRFHICGFCEQDYQDTLDRLSKENIVIYHGLVDDMESIYKVASCIVHPTYYPEGLSNVLLEAASSGKPIITTNRSGCREVIDNGVNGYVVKQKNSKDLIAKIEMFLKLSIEEREAMGLAGRAKVEKEFDRKIVIQKYMEEIRRASR